jgi:hypothetical protein
MLDAAGWNEHREVNTGEGHRRRGRDRPHRRWVEVAGGGSMEEGREGELVLRTEASDPARRRRALATRAVEGELDWSGRGGATLERC